MRPSSNTKKQRLLIPTVIAKKQIHQTNLPQKREIKKENFKDKKFQQQKNLEKKRSINKHQINNKDKSCSFSTLPFNCFCLIVKFVCSRPMQIFFLTKVCSIWRKYFHLKQAQNCWSHLQGFQFIQSYPLFKKQLLRKTNEQRQKLGVQFQKIYIKLFNYGSTKQNIPNKLINKLALQLSIEINSKTYLNYPFKIRNFNFSSYIYCKVQQLAEFKFDLLSPHNMFKSNLKIRLLFNSRKYRIIHAYNYNLIPSQIVQCSLRTKAFNYFIDKNIVIPYFEGDDRFLYFFFEISAVQLLKQIRACLKNKHNNHIQSEMRKLPLYKQLNQGQFQNFRQYFKFQSDFEVHMSYHNSQRQIFTHCDTKVYPIEISAKEAFFKLAVNDSFERVPTFLLDDKQGISQRINGLFLLDFILKDRETFLIAFSGFVYALPATSEQRLQVKDYLSYADLPIYYLRAQVAKFKIQILLIQESKRNFIKQIAIRMSE